MTHRHMLCGLLMTVLCVPCLTLADGIEVTTVVVTNNGVIRTTVSAHVVTNRFPSTLKTPTRRQMAPSMALRMLTQCAGDCQTTNGMLLSSQAVECTVISSDQGSVDKLLTSANDKMKEYGWQCRAVTNPVTRTVIIEAAEGGIFRQREWKAPTRRGASQRSRRTSPCAATTHSRSRE